MPKTLQDEIAVLGRERATALKLLPPAALRALPKSQSETLVVRGKKIVLTVYRDFWDDRTLIVIQIYRPIFLGYRRMFVLGFTVASDGTIASAEPKMLWDYT